MRISLCCVPYVSSIDLAAQPIHIDSSIAVVYTLGLAETQSPGMV